MARDDSPAPPSPPPTIGSAPAYQRLLAQVERLAQTGRPVLICGPSGAGKEVIAQQLHWQSCEGKQAFVDLNCGAIPVQLIEAELFGCVRGAYTGAVTDRPGVFEMAGNGTLFLDEIGELPLALQPALLRVLETRQYRPVGGTRTRHFGGRVIAATNRNLREMVQEGRFREDLYYRLAVFELQLPTLAERHTDIPALAEHFAASQDRPLRFAPDALALLERQPWPGNVRELRNLIDRIAVLSDEVLFDAATLRDYLPHAPAPWQAPVAATSTTADSLAEALLLLEGADKLAATERLLVEHALRRCAGNKSEAARLLGVNRKTIERRLAARSTAHDRVLQSHVANRADGACRSPLSASHDIPHLTQ
ncbi:sigma-54-dependent Fis family transcriptional regulator [Massilia arenosa]|uniref:Sigma-54-dependent Fis family transcriptional regulator n=1 Tax=Zemynaea arenosa TaxID=2561931 RepID=A0A4Y9SKP6_9BURK|nr:sigma-54 dependent transcriptional regulator [Massilia arenosa]TFW23436.1 sigma-54-dependent Fis family transcriptional regulator [Massilia arenosa]